MTNPDPAQRRRKEPPMTNPDPAQRRRKEPPMTNPDPATPTPGRTGPPWTEPGTVFFYGGFMSNFAPTPGLRLPFGYRGHRENDRVPVVRTVEHWFQACKATSRRQFDVILACGTAAAAMKAGRETELRPDWEEIPGSWPRTARTTRCGAAATSTAGTPARTCSDWR